jgi:hypothetical protein
MDTIREQAADSMSENPGILPPSRTMFFVRITSTTDTSHFKACGPLFTLTFQGFNKFTSVKQVMEGDHEA